MLRFLEFAMLAGIVLVALLLFSSFFWGEGKHPAWQQRIGEAIFERS